MAPAFPDEADEAVFDEEPVIEDDRGDECHLLIGQGWVLDAGEASLVAVSEHVAEFAACCLHVARDDQGGIAEIETCSAIGHVGRQNLALQERLRRRSSTARMVG